jgi:SAM-dependent methyltransferase
MIGNMHTAPDGSPVQLYLRLPDRTEDAALIHGLLPAGGTVLDLGCATGRLAEPLAEFGHPVTGVDNEAEMLGALRLAAGVHAQITTLDLATRFDAVLLMSHFVNAADGEFVDTILATVRRHMREDGFAVVERHPPGWAATCTESTTDIEAISASWAAVFDVGEHECWLRDLGDRGWGRVAFTRAAGLFGYPGGSAG